jgi:hypothetical protein
MGELHQAGDLVLRIADKLVLGQPACVDLTQQSANLVVQLQQLSAVGLVGLQALGQLVQRKLGLRQPGVVRQVGQPRERAFVIDALVAALLDLPVLLFQ